MNPFLKVLLIAIGVIVALKVLPFALVMGGLALAGIAAAAIAGLSLVAALLGAAFVVAVLLSPIWVPVLMIVGVIALCRRSQTPA